MHISWKHTLTVLLGLLVIGAFLRWYELGNNSFVADEFLDMNSAYGYRETGQWQAWDFNFGKPAETNLNAARDERAFIYKWQVARLFEFLPPTEAVARSVSVLWGILSILVVFWSTLVFTRRRDIGLVAAFLSAVSVSAIIMSRRLRMYAMFFPLYLAAATTLYAFYEIEYRGKVAILRSLWEKYGLNFLYLVPALVLAFLSLLTHQLAPHLLITLGVSLLVSTMFALRRGLGWRNKYGYSVALGLLAAIALVLFAPRFVGSFTAGLVFFDNHTSYIAHALRDFATPVIGVVVVACGLWCLALGDGLKNRSAALHLGLSFLVPLLMAIFLWRRNVGAQYIFFIQSFIMIAAAIGLVRTFDLVRERLPVTRKYALVMLVLVLVALVPNWGYFFEENNTYHETSTGGNPNYRKVFAYFKKEQRPTDILITRNFRNYYWSGAKVPVYDFGGELSQSKLSLEEVQRIVTEHSSGWFIYSGNDEDYISGDVERFAEKNLERVSNAQVRGDIKVFRWGTERPEEK